MQLVRFDPNETGWGLVDDEDGVVRHIAGPLPAWSPRIAGGEGAWALPRTGRVTLPADPLSDLRPMLGRLVHLPGQSPTAAPWLAAVIGASLVGRRNPFRSIFGYGLLIDSRRCATVVTRDEFGDLPPEVFAAPSQSAWSERLQALDSAIGLRVGDMVVLGTADLEAQTGRRLSAANLRGACRKASDAAGQGAACRPQPSTGER